MPFTSELREMNHNIPDNDTFNTSPGKRLTFSLLITFRERERKRQGEQRAASQIAPYSLHSAMLLPFGMHPERDSHSFRGKKVAI